MNEGKIHRNDGKLLCFSAMGFLASKVGKKKSLNLVLTGFCV